MEPDIDYLKLLETETANRMSKPGGPQKIIPPDLITALTGILMTFVQSCLGSGETEEAVTARVKKPGSYERAVFRRKFIDQEFNGEGRRYRKAGGDKLLEEFLAIHKDASDEQAAGLVHQIATKRIINHTMI